MDKKYKPVIFEFILVVAGFFLVMLLRDELAITAIVLLAIIVLFNIRYAKGEFFLLLLGILSGVIIEIGGDTVYHLQYWSQGSFFGIPIWLPLLWGYGFVLIRRLGDLIVKN